ncbi:MAG: porphobilinogen synthase [Xanthomonadales bacterium]|nr:porphobilinogen synthase [Xanthomonadales bacterium]
MQKYPLTRKRRLRYTQSIRDLAAENTLNSSDLIWPVFVLEGENRRESIKSMPGVYRLSQDLLIEKLAKLYSMGLKAVALFPVVTAEKKSEQAEEAYNSDGLVQRSIRKIKSELPEILVISDIALDPFTIHGQDGLIDESGYVLNDETVEVLCKQAVSHARAGVDIVAPSDMMDGRILKVREALESNGYINTSILAYSAKYASCFYGPFRDAVGSSGNLGKSTKENYQMNPANGKEALDEIAMDIDEGADMVMVKPGLPYLDIIKSASETFNTPVFAYQVSGEYAMLQSAIDNGFLDEKKAILESLLCFKRAGCDAILTYYADRVLEYLNE